MMGFLLASCGVVTNLMGGKDIDLKLYAGIIDNNLEVINEALDDGANINEIKGRLSDDTNPVWIAFKHATNNRIPEYLINRGADVNIPDKDGNSLLGWMANSTDVHFCELLIKHGAKIDYEYKGYTALEYVLDHNGRATATEKNIDRIITMLLEHGAKIRPESLKAALKGIYERQSKTKYRVKKRILEGLLQAGYKSGLDPALEAALLGDSSRLNALIKEDKIKKEDEEHILFSTAAFGSIETMKLLKDKDIDLGFMDEYKYTPLIVASYYGNLEMTKYLVNEGVNIETRTTDADSNKSALNEAVENDQYDVAEYLINKGADLKPFALFAGSVDVLNEASQNGNIKMIKLILDNGYPLTDNSIGKAIYFTKDNRTIIMKYFLDTKIDINFEYEGRALLAYAEGLDGIKFLVERGAKVNGKEGESYLRSASESGAIDVVDYLIKKGVNVNAINISTDGEFKGKKLDSALMKAIVRGNFEVVKLLVENGADLEYKWEQVNNDTAVILASGCGSKHILEYLIKKGANINYKNKKGETALMRAASKGGMDNVKLLINNKADKNLKDNEGHTATDLARTNKRKDVVDFLEKTK